MIGTITTLSTGGASGWIRAENGRDFPFEISAVFAYDASHLAVGQAVTFELDGESRPEVANVCVRRHRGAVSPTDRTRYRYVGFEQRAGIRAYVFERLSSGEAPQTCIVTTDMLLFQKHQVHLQDGPALCLHLLLSEPGDSAPASGPVLERSLKKEHIVAHLAKQPTSKARS